MSKPYTILAELKRKSPRGYWADRILAEIEYALMLSKTHGGQYDRVVTTALDSLANGLAERRVIDETLVRDTESALSPIEAAAKSLNVICVAHAHIDMNWMWRFDETVAVTIDTFRTILDLMDEYPEFCFSQSQASVYRIIEEYAPDMLEPIRARVAEGRWEVTASTWVEADKNMPNGESMARHILYTKRYLSKLLGISPKRLQIDFEPDTFGHSANVPEILARGGVKYYYHCRGAQGDNIRRWKAPSGNQVIVYREPQWYNAEISPDMALHVPEFCSKYGLDTALKVYGVGDHGGGPTRRDLNRLIDMDTWPIYPHIKFGTLHQFFALLDPIADRLPEVNEELNCIFTGCYTSQSRIKAANRRAESTLVEAESFSALGSTLRLCNHRQEALAKGWRDTLFNQFHDIITGSGTIDTREYALGLFQETMATAGTVRSQALRAIASHVEMPPREQAQPAQVQCKSRNNIESTSEGAGVGFGVDRLVVSQVSRDQGNNRYFVVFNASDHAREEVVEFVIWDWDVTPGHIEVIGPDGTVVQHQLLDASPIHYWGHSYRRLLVAVSVPAFGYSAYRVTESDEVQPTEAPWPDQLVERPHEYILENELVKAVLDPQACSLLSLVDKKTGEDLVPEEQRSGVFQFVIEDDSRGMTAWRVGRHMTTKSLIEGIRVTESHLSPSALRQYVRYEVPFSSSNLQVEVSLDKGSSRIDYSVTCDWREIGEQGKGIPSLRFLAPVSYPCNVYRYDVPFGAIDRIPLNMDVPANSVAAAVRSDPNLPSVALVSDSKYGYRGYSQSLSVSLIRSSFNPDPYPEIGVHKFRLGLVVAPLRSNKQLIDIGVDYNRPMSVVSVRPGDNSLPATGSLLEVDSSAVAVSSVKVPEDCADSDSIVVRLYETQGTSAKVPLTFKRSVASASLVDITEQDSEALVHPTDSKTIVVEVRPYSVTAVKVDFE